MKSTLQTITFDGARRADLENMIDTAMRNIRWAHRATKRAKRIMRRSQDPIMCAMAGMAIVTNRSAIAEMKKDRREVERELARMGAYN
jgi:hypothetical protein